MKLYTAALLFLLLVGSLSPVHGILEALNTNLKCRCSRDTSKLIPLSQIEKIEVIPPGNGCPNKEVIILTKGKKAICLRPQSKRVKAILNYLHRKHIHSTPSAPVSKRKPA
ncbi:C-X-C motif chemokine 13 [Perognathus longimembris pacificus]|uniref:C-X-C motif chemokine 13 n=1 Tax=Perognathus longimembris pacificus TaxID=214514 RepID=UPI00201A1F7A|nr:C-X-C motif chemokine 13 [Perognathus longimembris pacificus]